MLITNMYKKFQKFGHEGDQITQKVAQMTKNLNGIQLSQNWCRSYFKNADYEDEHNCSK